MFNLIRGSCPYQNWTFVARERCPNPDHFHCLKDEYGRIGLVCTDPIWVEKDRCPIFNVVAKKLDTTSCLQTRCPPYSYRSNDVDVEYVCRYIMERESSTTPFTTKETETNGIIVALTVLTIVTIIVFVACIVCYKCRQRQRSKNNGKGQEKCKDHMQESDTGTPNKTEEPKSLLNRTNDILSQW